MSILILDNNASGNEHFSYSHQWESTSNQEFNQLESNGKVYFRQAKSKNHETHLIK